MVVQYMEFIGGEIFPAIYGLLNSLMIADGVSLIGLSVAVILLSVVIGAFLFRV